jgi:sulfatase-like protein
MKKNTITLTIIQLIYSIYFYILMEWLFFSTKPSFMSLLSLKDKILLLLLSVIPFLLYGFILYAGLFFLKFIITYNFKKLLKIPILAIAPSIFATIATIILVDNFTYTIFKTGIIKITDNLKYFYLLSILILFIFYIIRFFKSQSIKQNKIFMKIKIAGVVILPVLSSILFIIRMNNVDVKKIDHQVIIKDNLPNIIVFASDGIEAKNLSAYGYYRRTTPALDELLPDALICRNAITNVSRTTGSTISMLNGKYPATTKVFFPPHVLTGKDSYQHLPGILKSLGYNSLQETARYYADAADLNMINSFDEANNRVVNNDSRKIFSLEIPGKLSLEYLFYKKIIDRIKERMLHLMNVKKMVDVHGLVEKIPAKVYGFSDRDRIKRAIDFMERSKGPFFLHLHLMETHSGAFKPKRRIFSADEEEQTDKNWIKYYDDMILNSDVYFDNIITWLKKNNKFENTLIVYYSDHTSWWNFTRRVPLIFFFPKGKLKGQIHENVQLMDVTPTILDYLNISIPEWVEGRSLISGKKLSKFRPIFSVGELSRTHFMNKKDLLSKIIGEGSPLYGLKIFAATICNQWYKLNVINGKMRNGIVYDHLDKCNINDLPDKKTVKQMLSKHLQERGFLLPFMKKK